jgi:hypothetical protein
MDIKCPNCKGPATEHIAGRDADHPGMRYIDCNECGWFEVIPGVTPEYHACDPPKKDQPEPVEDPRIEDDDNEPVEDPSPPKGNDPTDDDELSIEICWGEDE